MENDEIKPDTGENAADTGEIREEVGPYKPPKATRFSSDRQPDPSKQRATKAKKKFHRELMKELLSQKFVFKEGSELKKQLETSFGPRAAKLTSGEIMALLQIQKAILKGDTVAFKELMNQAYGQPKQALEHSGPGGGPIETTNRVTKTVIIKPPPGPRPIQPA